MGVGAELPDMPAWLDADLYVYVPLERTYRAAWDVCPPDFRHLVEFGSLPDERAPAGWVAPTTPGCATENAGDQPEPAPAGKPRVSARGIRDCRLVVA